MNLVDKLTADLQEHFPEAIMLSWEETNQWFPHRSFASHKYVNGVLVSIVGSRTYPGAAILSTRAAVYIGSGAVKAMVPQSLWPLLPLSVPEAIPISLPETNTGSIACIEEATYDTVVNKARSLLIGCGLTRHEQTIEMVQTVLRQTHLPLTIDGDALYALSLLPSASYKAYSDGHWVLTPHLGELDMLIPNLPQDPWDRLKVLQQKAIEWRCTILYKGFPGVVLGNDGAIWVCPMGSPAATTAGCGDVLAGACAGLMAQGVPPQKAAALASSLVARASTTLAEGRHSITASELLRGLQSLV